MHTFNSDVLARLEVAVALANNHRHDDTIFTTYGFRPPAAETEWHAVAALAGEAGELLHLIAAGEHRAAAERVNSMLRSRRVTPYVEPHEGGWALHFHAADAGFAEGWAGGIAAALAMWLSTPGAHRIGRCAATGCTDLFLDRGRNQRRRFCGLRCQNRAKSADYRRTRRHVTPGPE